MSESVWSESVSKPISRLMNSDMKSSNSNFVYFFLIYQKLTSMLIEYKRLWAECYRKLTLMKVIRSEDSLRPIHEIRIKAIIWKIYFFLWITLWFHTFRYLIGISAEKNIFFAEKKSAIKHELRETYGSRT